MADEVAVDATPSGFSAFRDELVRRVPGIPRNASPQFDVTRHGLLDHFQRTGVRRAVTLFAPSVVPQAIDSCRTLGELFELLDEPDYAAGINRDSFSGRYVTLRPLHPSDYQALYDSALSPSSSFRWRYRGVTPSPQEFEGTLFDGVLTQFAVAGLEDDKLWGLVVAYNHRPEVGACHFAFQRADGGDPGVGGELVEGAFLFLTYLFTTFNLRRVRIELPEYNSYLVDGVPGTLLMTEGELVDALWHGGRYWAMKLLAIDRAAWESFSSAFFSS